MYYPDLSPQFAKMVSELFGKKVAVIGHARPDGDSVGSQIALTRCLISQGIDAIAINKDAVPRLMKEFVADTPFVVADHMPEDFHEAVFVDCATAKRATEPVVRKFKTIHGCIDHHLSNNGYATHNIIDPNAAATAEMLTAFMIDCKMPIDEITAQALYLGIATDTGQFQYPNTTPEVFKLCQKLMRFGANPSKMASLVCQRESLGKLRLLRTFLDSLQLEFDGRICIGTLLIDDYKNARASRSDSEGLVDYARAVDGVEIGILLEQRSSEVKGSIRAKEEHFRVDQLAGEFGGGGHACAAGFSCGGDIESIKAKFIDIATKHIKAL